MPDIESLELARRREIRIVDVRDADERDSGIGIIPGSRMFVRRTIYKKPQRFLRVYRLDWPLCFACLSGKRSERLVPFVQQLGFRYVYNLRGGLLAWAGDELPLGAQCDREPSNILTGLRMEQVARQLVSCYVAEAVENALNTGADLDGFDPRETIDQFLAEERPAGGHTEASLLEVLDRVTEQARLDGHPLARIARNMDRMRRMVMMAEVR